MDLQKWAGQTPVGRPRAARALAVSSLMDRAPLRPGHEGIAASKYVVNF